MTIWATRQEALVALEGSLQGEASALAESLAIVDEAIARLEDLSDGTAFTRVAAMVLVKARNLAVGCYSLSLDGLAQEGGAIFRPLIEALELITYLRMDPRRTTEATDGTLPRAGDIARAIQGRFQKMRNYLNTHASHFSFSWEALRHIVNVQEGKLRTSQVFREPVLRTNMAVLSAVVVMIGVEAVNCVQVHKMGSADDLANRVENARDRVREVFKGIVPDAAPPDAPAAV